MKGFSLLIKPTSADCNLRCTYCFYLEKLLLYPETKIHRMSDATLEKLISLYMSTPQKPYTFGWQGGEPTLMGLDFFKKVVKLQKKYAKPGSMISNGLQTNGTLINESLARFLSEYNFLVGVSIDGPRYIHDHYRKTASGRGSFTRVMKGIELLKKNNVEFNILVLVNDFNVDKAKEIYHFLVDMGFYFHQYIPCVEFDSNGSLKYFSINGEQWGRFLIELFNQWYPRDINRISIRLFDSIINRLTGRSTSMCSMENNCNHYLVIEHNGDVYPCDFFVRKELKLGNIASNSFDEILNSDTYIDFGKAKSQYSFLCNSCPYLKFCYGDCLKHRNYITGQSRKLSTLCSGWKMFYGSTLDIFKNIADSISN